MHRIDIEAIKALRAQTQAGMMDCKAALMEAQGNQAQAVTLLMARGHQIAEKKAERVAVDGAALAEMAHGRAALVEVNTESDFVAANARFVAGVRAIARAAARHSPADMAAMLACTVEEGEGQTVADALAEMSLAFREKIVLRRFAVLAGAMPYAYTHAGGQYGAVVTLAADGPLPEAVWQPVAKEMALQIAACAPRHVSRAHISVDERAQIEAGIAAALDEDAAAQGKPQAIRDRILAGRVQKYYRTHCLMEQPYIRDPEQTVEAYLKAAGAGVGVDAFCRYQRADGLQPGEASSQQYARQLSKER